MITIERKRGLAIILSSPSGAGKSSIVRSLLQHDNNIISSISVTTRPPRPGEVNFKDYIFVDNEKFESMILNEELLEFAKVFGYYYGSPKLNIMNYIDQCKDVIFDIDWQGALSIKQHLSSDVVSIYILPPSYSELLNRLKLRNQDSEEVINMRMQQVKEEISHHNKYEYVIMNSGFELAVKQIYSIITAERLKYLRANVNFN